MTAVKVPAMTGRQLIDRYRGKARGPRSRPARATLRRYVDEVIDAWDGTRMEPGVGVIRHWIRRRPTEDESHIFRLLVMHRHIEVSVSPTGDTVRIFVDHHEVPDRPPFRSD